jgi:ubiquinone biosynthesis protein UbiJ
MKSVNEQQAAETLANVIGEIVGETEFLAIDRSPENEAKSLKHLALMVAKAMRELEESKVQPPSWLEPVGKLLLVLAELARRRVDSATKPANDDADA